MKNQWSDFDDFELACLCADYGYEDALEIVEILPVKLANRAQIEAKLRQRAITAARDALLLRWLSPRHCFALSSCIV